MSNDKKFVDGGVLMNIAKAYLSNDKDMIKFQYIPLLVLYCADLNPPFSSTCFFPFLT